MPPALRVAVEDDDVVAERREVARDGERGRPGADAGDALAVLLRAAACGRRSRMSSLLSAATRFRRQIATGSGFSALRFLDAAAPARRLARTIAGAPEDAGEDVRLPVDHVGVAVAAGGDQPDVFGNGRVGGTRPLAIDDFVEVVGIADIGGSQVSLSTPPKCGGCTAMAQEQTCRCLGRAPSLVSRVCVRKQRCNSAQSRGAMPRARAGWSRSKSVRRFT